MSFYIGIDGGGSNIRVAVVKPDLTVVGQADSTSVNPNIVGFPTARKIIQETIDQALQHANLKSSEITGVGIGVAGAPQNVADSWLRETLTEVLPHSEIVPSSDHEIALVGAHGERRGILVLAGTGSLAYGVSLTGDSCLVSGWGYLSGDEGSGYWIGNQALTAIFRADDGRGAQTTLTAAIFDTLNRTHQLNLTTIWDLLDWRYQKATNRMIAQLAQVVLAQASEDKVARHIIVQAVNELYLDIQTVKRRLKLKKPPIAFTGGLLTHQNMLSQQLCEKLRLTEIPQRRYEPVIGAAILAREAYQHA